MAHFYATIQGNRKEATRMGTASSGIVSKTASWEGAVRVELWQHGNGKDYATVSLVPWHGNGKEKLLYQGRVDGE